jgi:DNA-binding NarL/FixJ family response regulator
LALRCVVVEDQVMFLELLVAMLKAKSGLEVVATARGVAEGINACQQHQPDLLILDLALPDGHGLAVIEALCDQLDPPRVIVLSGQASSFVCPAVLRPLVQAVVDKTRAFNDLNAEIQPLLPVDVPEVASGTSLGGLTLREQEVFALIGQGCTNRAIAETLGLSLRTVETHRKNVNHKMGAKGAELVRLATLELERSLGRVD